MSLKRTEAKKLRIVILTEARIGKKMGGTGIRYLEIARLLSKELDVLLGSAHPIDLSTDDVETFVWNRSDSENLLPLISSFDFVLVHGYVLDKLPWISDLDVRIIVDLYCPFIFENLEVFRDREEPDDETDRLHGRDRDVLLRQLESGDFFLCSNERQRDWILGMLTATGQLGPSVAALRNTPDSLAGIVPTGLTEVSPSDLEKAPVLKEVWPGVKKTDVVLIWGGGIWSWLDAETLIRAMAHVRSQTDNVKLFFLSRITAEEVIGMPAVERAVRLAVDLGLTENEVIFNKDYVAYEDRDSYFREADIGVCADTGSLESHFSFRTRMLDYLKAGLPILTSDSEYWGDFVRRHGLGEALPTGDAEAWARAIVRLAKDPEKRSILAQQSHALSRDFSWEKSVLPLIRYCLEDFSGVSPRGRLRGWDRSVEFTSLQRVYQEAVGYARHLEAELKGLQGAYQDAVSYARRLESRLGDVGHDPDRAKV